MLDRALPLVLVLALAPAARAQGKVTVEPAEVDEGRPVTLRVTWTPGAGDALGLLALEARAGEERVAHEGPSEREALFLAPLADAALTLDLEATEDLGPVARAPQPPVVGRLAGTPVVILPLVAPGEAVPLELPLVPRAGEVEVELVARFRPLPAPGPLGGVALYVPGEAQRWSPDEAEHVHGPRVTIATHLTRWVPRGAEPASEVLGARDVLERLAPAEQRLAARVKVRPARFGLAAAAARAGLQPTAAVRLQDDRWIVQDATRAAVVGEQGAPVTLPGGLLPWALDLAETGRASLRWYEGADRPDLVKALEQAGFVRAQGKGIDLEVTTESLARLLEVLEQHGMTLRDGRLAPR